MPIKVPSGFAYDTTNEFLVKDKIIRLLMKVLTSEGYFISVPFKLTCTDSNGVSESAFEKKIKYKTIDNEGHVLSLASDIVPPTILASAISGEKEFKLFSYGDVYRFDAITPKNSIQFCAVNSGNNCVAAQAEMISLALKIAEVLSEDNVKVVIGDVEILFGIYATYMRKEAKSEEIAKLLADTGKNEIEKACIVMLKEIMAVKGDILSVKEIAAKLDNKNSIDALCRLYLLDDILTEYGLSDKVEYDFGYIPEHGYESRLSFKVLSEDGKLLLNGGGYHCNAENDIFSGVYLKGDCNYLADKLFYKEDKSIIDVVVGVYDGITALAKAYKIKGSLFKSGLNVHTIYGKNSEETKIYANSHGIANAIFVDGKGNLEYV